MEADGHSVKFFSDRPSESFINKIVIRLRPSLMREACLKYFKTHIDSLQNFVPDIVVVIKGEGLNRDAVSYMRGLYKEAAFVNYQWDSIKNVPSFHEFYDLFDHLYSFDQVDSAEYSLKFRPLFYLGESVAHKSNISQNSEFVYHLSFIGTMHSDRYAILCKIQKNLDSDIRYFWYNYVTDKAMFYIRKVFDYRYFFSRLSDFRFEPLPKQEVYSIFSDSNCILDVERPRQRGLTMRTLEVLSLGKKLITTNKDVVNYDLYSSGNVLVIDRDSPNVPVSFLKEPPRAIDSHLLAYYSLSTWLEEVIYKHI